MGRGGDRACEVIGVCVAECMRLDVRAHSSLEYHGPQEVLEHADDGSTFLVRNTIECRVDIAVARDRLADHSRADQAVGGHGAFGAFDSSKVRAVLGVKLLGYLL